MSSIAIRAARVAGAAACSALVFTALPQAGAAPGFDSQGYLDSTARCTAPDTAVLFGSTDTARVAICKTSGGKYQYRGVRVRDGAKLVLSAASNGDGSYAAENDGMTYTVSPSSLVISSGRSTVRTESWVDFHGPQSTGSSATSTTASTSTSASATTSTTATSTTPTSTTPLPPPLPAEVGGTSR